MSITFVTPHQRPNSGGVYAIEQFALHAAVLTEVHLIVVKGDPQPLPGVTVHPWSGRTKRMLPLADALLIPADLQDAEALFELAPEHGVPIVLLQGYGFPDAPVVTANLARAPHAICTASWLVDRAQQADCSASLVRYGLDRAIFSAGSPPATRGPVASLMTHTLDWKGTADGLAALALAQAEIPELAVRLFGKGDPASFGTEAPSATYLPSPNRLSEVAALMRESAVFVCSSWEEGFGIPGIEAITSGAALATTDTKGSRDYAFDDRTALVTAPQDPQALAASIVTLLKDPDLRTRLTEAGRRHIEALHPAWDRAAETLLAATHSAAGGIRQQRLRHGRLEAELDRRAIEVRRVEEQLKQQRATRVAIEDQLADARQQLADAADRSRRLARELTSVRTEARIFRAQLEELERDRLGVRGPEPITPSAGVLEALDALAQLPSAAAAPLSPVRLNAAAPAGAIARDAVAAERATAAVFAGQYAALLELVGTRSDGIDPLALAIPQDIHAVIAATGERQEPGEPTVDVVIPVHNALEDTRRCLWALLHRGTRRFRLIIVNDGSDPETSQVLSACAEQLPAIMLIERDAPPHGYCLAANAGLRASSSDYVVLLNSDTRVTRGWLERIIRHGEAHPELGVLGPLSNAASHQSVPERRDGSHWATNPLPDWLTEDGMALLTAATPLSDPRLPFINGFCYVIRRAVIDTIGLLDEERFPAGFGEENDYSLRAREAGFELSVVSDAYVYHAKSKSYGVATRTRLARDANRVLQEKHGEQRFAALVAELEADTTLEPARAALAAALTSPAATETALRTAAQRPRSVAFVLPGLSHGGSGGSHSIYQETHGLRRLGVDARILLSAGAMDRAREAYEDADELFEPVTDADDLSARTVGVDVLVATHFKSVASVARACRARQDVLPAYYIQDYEPLFQFGDPADNREAAGSYTAMPGALLFAKTHWLCNVVSRRHGVFVAKVEPSIDTDVYAAAPPIGHPGPLRIAAMIRPRTPRRQPSRTLALLERLRVERPGETTIRTFGCDDAELGALGASFEIRAGHAGVIRREQVADLLRESDLFLDMSTYQAFGRTALEAMACGTTAIVPRYGGIWEFVSPGENALVVDTLDPEHVFAAAVSLIDAPDQVLEMRRAAHQTASRYSVVRASVSELAVLSEAYRRLAERWTRRS